MLSLITDVQKLILEFLNPNELRCLYELSKNAKQMMNEIIQNTNFVVRCTYILSDKEILWLETKGFQLQLLETYENNDEMELWFKNGLNHRDYDLPASISNGDYIWFQYGKIHRDNDMPAVIWDNGTQVWYQNGRIHRDRDLPALITKNGNQVWFQNGQRIKTFKNGTMVYELI